MSCLQWRRGRRERWEGEERKEKGRGGGMEEEGKEGKEIIVQLIGWAVSSLECDMCVGVVCDVGVKMDVLPKLHDRLWLLVATTQTPLQCDILQCAI